MKQVLLSTVFLTNIVFAQSAYVDCRDRGYGHSSCNGQGRAYVDCRDRGYGHSSCSGQSPAYVDCRESGYAHSSCANQRRAYIDCRNSGYGHTSCNGQRGGGYVPQYPSYPQYMPGYKMPGSTVNLGIR